MGLLYPDLDTPSVLLDLNKVEANIRRMAQIAREAGLKLRPHTKTHKSPEIARIQLNAGACGITVAKLGEAEVMADAGITDILIAFPLIGRQKLERLAALHRRAQIRTSTDSLEVALGLSRVGEEVGRPVPVYIEVDTGLARCGHKPGDETVALVRQMAGLSGIQVIGVMTHEGHAWSAPGGGVEAAAAAAARELAETAAALRSLGFPCSEVSVGATPTAFYAHASRGATELRPGTYVFNDVSVVNGGFVTEQDCAVTVIAAIVGRPAANRVILDVGSKTLSQDGAAAGRPMGRILDRPDWRIAKLTEEHGIVQVPEDAAVTIGDRVEIIPNHVCVVTNLTDSFVTTRGGQVVGTLRVAGRGRTQ
jgi:D-serine deaminase-like pyridoxal phosphate-dependent protein